jgi:hypothetical protein
MDGESYKIDVDFAKVDEAAKQMVSRFTETAAAGTLSFLRIEKAAATAAYAFSRVRSAMSGIGSSITVLPSMIGRAFSMITSPIRAVFGGIASMVKGVFNTVTGTLSRIGGFIKSTFTSIFSGVSDVIKTLLPLAGIGLFAGIAHGLKVLKEDEDAFTRMSSAIKITGGIAGFTSKEIEKLAEKIAKASRFGDDLVVSAAAIGLQFKNVRGDNFARALQLSADMAARLGIDLESAAQKMFQALDQPGERLMALEKAGEVFTETEKDMLAQMSEAGMVAEAQAKIMDRLAESFGGAAAEDAKTFSGIIFQVNEAMDDAWKAIAQALVPALKVVADYFKAGAQAIESWGPALEKTIAWVMEWVGETQGVLQEWIDWGKDEFLKWSDYLIDKIGVVAAFLQVAIPNAMELVKIAMKKPGVVFAWVKAEGLLAFEGIKNAAFDIFDQISKKIRSVWDDLMNMMEGRFVEGFDRMILQVQASAANLNPGSKIKEFLGFGDQTVTAHEVEKQVQERARGRKLEADLRKSRERMAEENGRDMGKPEGFEEKKADERIAKMNELQKAVEEARTAMGEAGNFQSPDFSGWESRMNELKNKMKEFFGADEEEPDGRTKGKGEKPYSLKKDDEKKSGGFEGLLDLQKRIAGAASGRRPIEATMSDLLKVTKEKKAADDAAAKKQEIAGDATVKGAQAQIELLAMAQRGELFGSGAMGA